MTRSEEADLAAFGPFSGVLSRGAGDIRYTTKVAIFSVVIIRTGVSYFFGSVLHFGIVGIWFGVLADQFFRCLLGMLRFRSGKWTSIKV